MTSKDPFFPGDDCHDVDHSRFGKIVVVNLRKGASGSGRVYLAAVNGQLIEDFDSETLRKVANPEWKTPLEADVDVVDDRTAVVTPRRAEAEDLPSFDECAEVIPFFDGTGEDGEPVTWKQLAKMLLEDRRAEKKLEEGYVAGLAPQIKRAEQDPYGGTMLDNDVFLRLVRRR